MDNVFLYFFFTSSALSFNTECYFCIRSKLENKEALLNPSMPVLLYLYLEEFGCNIVLCNRQGLGQNAAQKAVLLWSDVGCTVHSCASLSLQAAILLTSWWQTSQQPWLSVWDSHKLGRGFYSLAVPLSLFLNT